MRIRSFSAAVIVAFIVSALPLLATGNPPPPPPCNGEVISITINFGILGNKTFTFCAPKGPAGPIGPMGPMGPRGYVGPVGPAGPAGPQGLTGSAGPMGLQGVVGLNGEVGPQGAQGQAGVQGPVGPMGEIKPFLDNQPMDQVSALGFRYPTPVNFGAFDHIAVHLAVPTVLSLPNGEFAALDQAGTLTLRVIYNDVQAGESFDHPTVSQDISVAVTPGTLSIVDLRPPDVSSRYVRTGELNFLTIVPVSFTVNNGPIVDAAGQVPVVVLAGDFIFMTHQ